MEDVSKKDIAAQYAHRTLWLCMRVPTVLRAPFAVIAMTACAVKMVEVTIANAKELKNRVEVVPVDESNVFAGAFGSSD